MQRLITLYDSPNSPGAIDELAESINDYRILIRSAILHDATAYTFPSIPWEERELRFLDRAAEAFLDPTGPDFRTFALAGGEWIGARALAAGWTTAGPRLIAPALQIRLELTIPSERLRWEGLPEGSRPEGGIEHVQEMLSRIPNAMWPGWTLRLLPRDLPSTQALFRSVTACALLLPGSTLSVPTLCDVAQGFTVPAKDVTRGLQEILKCRFGEYILQVLGELAQAISTEPPPIDYARRRLLGTGDDLLCAQQWREYCGAAGVPPGDVRRLRLARVWLWETLTGGTFRTAPQSVRTSAGEYGTAYFHFTRTMTTALHRVLSEHAASVLHSNEITGEPVRWEPPLEVVSYAHWPGTDPATLDQKEIRRRLSSNESLGSIADRLGVVPEYVRLLASSGDFATYRAPSKRIQKYIPESALRRVVLDDHLTIRAAAEVFGVDRKTASAHCHKLGVVVNPAGRPTQHEIDPEWLKAQYLDHGRTLPEIATEIGCSTTSVARIARHADIPLRSPGGASHRSAVHLESGFPPLLATATRGQGGVERARRFIIIAQNRSLCAAAQKIGTKQSVLTTQLAKLERDAGGELLIRSSAQHEPHTLTPLGTQLLRQINTCLADPEPAVTHREPLQAALRAFRGPERVSRFLVVAEAPTIGEAAARLSTDPSTLVRSIVALERALGGELVVNRSRRAPLELTVLGHRLANQARKMAA